MPSHADRVRRQYEGEPVSTAPGEALMGPLSQLDRYAGWLAKDHVSVAVRADVAALGAAIEANTDTSLLLFTLDKDLGRLPGGDIRKMLRKALGEVRGILGSSEVDGELGEPS
jgi:hypothetical protein